LFCENVRKNFWDGELVVFLVALFLLTNGAFYAALADHHKHKQKSWYHKVFGWDDDNYHDRGKKKKRHDGTWHGNLFLVLGHVIVEQKMVDILFAICNHELFGITARKYYKMAFRQSTSRYFDSQ
jgi:hypothetical protein